MLSEVNRTFIEIQSDKDFHKIQKVIWGQLMNIREEYLGTEYAKKNKRVSQTYITEGPTKESIKDVMDMDETTQALPDSDGEQEKYDRFEEQKFRE